MHIECVSGSLSRPSFAGDFGICHWKIHSQQGEKRSAMGRDDDNSSDEEYRLPPLESHMSRIRPCEMRPDVDSGSESESYLAIDTGEKHNLSQTNQGFRLVDLS